MNAIHGLILAKKRRKKESQNSPPFYYVPVSADAIELAKKIVATEEFGDRDDLAEVSLIAEETVCADDLDTFESDYLNCDECVHDDHLGLAVYYLVKSIRNLDAYHTSDVRDGYTRLATMHYEMSGIV